MNAAIYCRVSTEEQASGGHSIEAQRQELIKYCHAFNYEIYDYYIDGGYSASTMDRPALTRLLNDVSKYDIALVWRLDRISRDMADLMKILEIFSSNNITFQSKTENFNTSTASGKLMLNMLGSFAEFERASISERIKMAHKKILNEGKWRGGQPPLGYALNEKKILEIHREEAKIIKKIFDLSAHKNIGARGIAMELNHLGYTSRNKKPFTSSYVARILKNPTYYGEMIHGKQKYVKKNGRKQVVYDSKFETYTGDFIPIISKDLFDTSQKNMEKRKSNRSTSEKISSPLSGLVFCGDCKEYLIRNKSNRDNHFFTCKSYKYFGKCTHHYISENVILKEIKRATKKLKEDRKELKEANKQLFLEKEKTLAELITEVHHFQVQIRSYIARGDKLFELIERGLITEEEFISRKNKLCEEKSQLVQLLQQANHQINSLTKNQDKEEFLLELDSFSTEFDKLPPSYQKKVLHQMIDRIEVFGNEKPYAPKKIDIYFKI